MPFADYASFAAVARAHQIRCERRSSMTPLTAVLSDSFRADLAFTLTEVPFDSSEFAASETLIYPMLREVWKPYCRELTLWSHQAISYDSDLCGVPDYMIARRSPLGAMILDQPYLLVVEAKQDDFERGWGQCLAAMRAAQKLNNRPDQTRFGIVTNGSAWQFGLLEGDLFTQDVRTFSLQDLDSLAAALNYMFAQCRQQLTGQPCAA